VIEDSTKNVLATYVYDPLSRRASATFGDGSAATYGYDRQDDLLSVGTQLVGTYFGLVSNYDGDQRRISAISTMNVPFPAPTAGSVSYSPNHLNQYTAIGSIAPTYDTAGNLKSDGKFTYTYDTEGHLLTANGQGHAIAYDWDAEGRLASTTLDGTAQSFDYNGTTPLGDWSGTAFATAQTQLRRHVFGAGGEPLYLAVDSVASYSHQDILGSTIALSNASAAPVGGLSAIFGYDPFGQPVTPITSVFGYAGQRFDPTTNLVYDGARFYSPAQGRFYSPDPIGYAGGNNLYGYVGNDPLNNTDPSGLAAQQVGSSQWNLTTASSQADLDTLQFQLTQAQQAGDTNRANQILAEIENLSGGSPAASGGGDFGSSTSYDYRRTFFAAHPELEGQVIFHHAVEQQVLQRYPGLVTESEIHSLQNLRGIPRNMNSELHLSQIRRGWNQFYRQNPNPTRQDLLGKAAEIDSDYGLFFNPQAGR
jgi:RHS repeat-associated protein